VRTSTRHRRGSTPPAPPKEQQVRPASLAFGPDHPLARASELVRTLEKQAGVLLAAIAPALAGTLLGAPIGPTLLSASLAVELVLVLALFLARQVRAERAWEVIINGNEAPDAHELMQERRRLSDPKRREQLSRSLARALDAAEHWHQILVASRPPEGVRLLSGFAPEIRQIISQLRDEPADVSGIALLARHLAGGHGSPLYSGDAEALRRELARIAHLLGCPPRRPYR